MLGLFAADSAALKINWTLSIASERLCFIIVARLQSPSWQYIVDKLMHKPHSLVIIGMQLVKMNIQRFDLLTLFRYRDVHKAQIMVNASTSS